MILGLIPSRLNSKRLKNKPLLSIDGLPIIIHTLKRAKMSKKIDKVIVCTDSTKVIDIVKKNGGEAVLTSINHKNGTERIYEVAKKYKLDLAQMSLKFLEIQPFVTSVIIGATTMEQLKTDIESVNINLTEEIINEINEVQKIYPNPCP